MDPQPPTSSLPSLRNITAQSLSTITAALINLRALYWPASLLDAAVRLSKPHVDQDVPDSGYASAEEDGDDDESAEERMILLRADALERAFTVRWLTGFIARSEEWVDAVPPSSSNSDCGSDKEQENRARVVEEAAGLLALSADTQVDGALAREFSFAVEGGGNIFVELRDESYEQDHESVGLQTWGSACVLARRICAKPDKYLGLDSWGGGDGVKRKVKVLELGAGTGLLSMVVAKLELQRWARNQDLQLEVVATDFHPAVLENLRGNVTRNFSFNTDAVRVDKLDWADSPVLEDHDKFDVILAADVIYDKRHGRWIKNCAEDMLKREKGRVMWLIVPRRPTRTGEVEGVDNVFCGEEGQPGLRIVQVEDVARSSSVGRADEDGYRLFKIAWAA